MSTYILTSMFANGFRPDVAEVFQNAIKKRNKLVFVASEFEKMHKKTDRYSKIFMDMFCEKNIWFEEVCVIDGRMTPEEAKKAARDADVIWLSGGDTLAQRKYLRKYGLDEVI